MRNLQAMRMARNVAQAHLIKRADMQCIIGAVAAQPFGTNQCGGVPVAAIS